MTPTEALGWKHGFPTAMAIPPDLAVVCVVRQAADWARSMHAKPWHTVPEMQTLEFSDFLRAPWRTVVDRARYFGGAEALLGQPLQADRDPLTGAVFPNLFALRRAKLAGVASYLNRDCTCVLLRMEDVQKNPERLIAQVIAALGHPGLTDFKPVTKRLGSKFKASVGHRPATPAGMPLEDRDFMLSELDLSTEKALGYIY